MHAFTNVFIYRNTKVLQQSSPPLKLAVVTLPNPPPPTLTIILNETLINPLRMREGYGSHMCLCVCVCVCVTALAATYLVYALKTRCH